jgi:two-component system OmpR family response regulator
VVLRSPCRLVPSGKGAGTLCREVRCRHLPVTTVVLHPVTTVVLHLVTVARLPVEVHLTKAPTADAVLAAVSVTERDADMRILLVEDEKDLQRLLKKALSEAGYVVDVAADGEEGHFLGDTEPYDAVVLDLGLPKMDGVTVLERWRKAGRKMPVLILTARDRWSDKVAGFDAGADDYVAKPFYTEELLARLRALLRRAAGIASADIEVGPLRIDTRSSRVTVEGSPIKLTSLEYRLLAYLAHHKGQVLSRTDLVEHLYDQDFDRDSNTIEVFIGRLRKKLGVDVIHTVRGLGYRLDEPSAGGDES